MPARLAVYLGMFGVGASVAASVAAHLRGALLAPAIALALASPRLAIAAVRRALRHAR